MQYGVDAHFLVLTLTDDDSWMIRCRGVYCDSVGLITDFVQVVDLVPEDDPDGERESGQDTCVQDRKGHDGLERVLHHRDKGTCLVERKQGFDDLQSHTLDPHLEWRLAHQHPAENALYGCQEGRPSFMSVGMDGAHHDGRGDEDRHNPKVAGLDTARGKGPCAYFILECRIAKENEGSAEDTAINTSEIRRSKSVGEPLLIPKVQAKRENVIAVRTSSTRSQRKRL